MTTEEKKSGISRRDLIKKGAVAGAIVWAVPMIETVPAYAAVGSVPAVGMSCSYGLIIYSDTATPTSTTNYYLARFGQNSSSCGSGANQQLSFGSPGVSTEQSGVTVSTLNTWSNVSGTLAIVTDSFGSHNITTIDCRGVGGMTTNNTVSTNSNYYMIAAFAWNYNQSSVGQVGTSSAPGSSITSTTVTFGSQC